MLRKIADVFQEDPGPDSTLADLQLLQQRFAPKPGVVLSAPAFGAALPVASPQPGTVYVHARRPHEPMPTFAFPFSPPEMERGELYEFCLHHIMTLDDPMSAFRLDVTET